jgi:hypothetical protein
MVSFLWVSWQNLLIGALIGAVLSPPVTWLYIWLVNRFKLYIPLNVLLNPFNRNEEKCLIVIPAQFSYNNPGEKGMLALSYLLTLLGQSGKTENIEIKEDNNLEDPGGNLIILDGHPGHVPVSKMVLENFSHIFYKQVGAKIFSVDGEFNEVEPSGYVVQRLTNEYNPRKKIFLVMGGNKLNYTGVYALSFYKKFFIKKFGNKDFGCVLKTEGGNNQALRVISYRSSLNILEKITYWIIGYFVSGPELPVNLIKKQQ